MKKLLLSLALAAICLEAHTAAAQAPAALPACSGTITIVRVSEIKPGKTDTFLAAVAAQLAWYRVNGITTNQIYASPVMVRGADNNFTFTSSQFLTFHINRPSSDTKLPRNDDAYKAFVKMFRESSDITSEYTTCGPKPAM